MEVRHKPRPITGDLEPASRSHVSDFHVLFSDILDCIRSSITAIHPRKRPLHFAAFAALLCLLIVAATLVPTDLEIDAETYFGRPDSDAARRDEGFGRGLFNETQTDGKFDVQAAARLWERHVGCASFRARHRHLINHFKDPLAWPPNPSLQDPTEPSCNRMKLRHVTVFVVPTNASGFDAGSIEGYYFCPRCRMTCQITFSEPMASHADATLHVAPNTPPPGRQVGDPLQIYLDMGRAAGAAGGGRAEEGDVAVWWGRGADVQLTFARFSDAMPTGRQHGLQPLKFQDTLVYWHEDDCQDPTLLAPGTQVAAHIPTHSFGQCGNNFNNSNEDVLFNDTCPSTAAHAQHSQKSHCLSSNYKFELVVDDPRLLGFVSWKLLRTLEAGTVPIYYGAPDVDNFMPPGSYIDGRKLPTPAELLAALQELHLDPLKYMDLFAWRTCGVWGQYAHVDALGFRSLPCRLCEAVSARHGRLFHHH
ncbi:unnamed protein product [Closterium sp. NIES-53]